MEVKVSFDTDKENIEDLKRLVASLQDLIKKREKSLSLGNPLAASAIKKPSQVVLTVPQPQAAQPTKGFTNGGGRVIPYEDMSGVLSKIVSGRKY